jgi:hypothetical protein
MPKVHTRTWSPLEGGLRRGDALVPSPAVVVPAPEERLDFVAEAVMEFSFGSLVASVQEVLACAEPIFRPARIERERNPGGCPVERPVGAQTFSDRRRLCALDPRSHFLPQLSQVFSAAHQELPGRELYVCAPMIALDASNPDVDVSHRLLEEGDHLPSLINYGGLEPST